MEGNPIVTLELKDGPYSRSMWDYSFQALYKVSCENNIHLVALVAHYHTVDNPDNTKSAL